MATGKKGLEDFVKQLEAAGISAKDLKRYLDDTVGAADSVSSSVNNVSRALESFSRAGMGNNDVLDSLVKTSSGLSRSFDDIGNALGRLPVVGKFASAFIAPFEAANGILENMVTTAVGVVGAIDNVDAGLRGFSEEQFKVAGSLGASFEESEKFAKSYRDIIKSNSELARQGLYIGSSDVKDLATKLQAAGIAIDELGDRSTAAAGKLNNAQAMAAQAKAMGMDMGTYGERISSMMRKSGMSMDDSMKIMAASQDIARDTGLRVDEVTASLDGATNGFQRMGTTMDFARPVLKGFSESIKDVGLGITQAGDLAADFSKTLLGIANNPALAYITSMKGGFMGGTGGGGVLNPSIQMQAAMLDQSPGAQAEMAKNLSLGIRDTLKSFTGSDIITVKEAAASPELQSKFYTQQQMLGSVYGISDTTTQNRVLEMLTKLEEATYSGDEEMASTLEKQINDTLQNNDKNFSLQEKISQNIEKTVMIAQEQLQIGKMSLIQGLTKPGTPIERSLLEAQTSLSTLDKFMSDMSSKKYENNSEGELLQHISNIREEESKGMKKTYGVPPESAGTSGAVVGTTSVAGTGPQAAAPAEIRVHVTAEEGYDVQVTGGATAAGTPALKTTKGKK